MIKRLRSVVLSLGLLLTVVDGVSANAGAGNAAAEIAGGALGLAAGVGSGFATMYALGAAIDWCGPNADAPCLFPAFVGIPVGAVTALFLIPAGVEIAGRATHGRGSYWAALIGSAGVAVPASITLMFTRPEDRVLFPVLGGLTALWVAASVVGYRVSAPHALRLDVMPVQDGRGALASISGRF